MKFSKDKPEKRRYVALLVLQSSSLTGANDWKARQLREQCEEAGWNFQCSSTYWQIFYTTDDAVKRVGDMREEIQFQIQRSLSWNWWVNFFYPILVVLEIWTVYQYLQNPGKLFADPMKLLFDIPVDMYEHFLDCILCTDVSRAYSWIHCSYFGRDTVVER